MQKNNYCPTSNEKLNIPMTEEQRNVVDFVAFESETSVIYPFQIGFDDMTMEMVESICLACKGCVYDTEVLYEACESILGTNSMLKEGKIMNNYICINDIKVELTAEQIKPCSRGEDA